MNEKSFDQVIDEAAKVCGGQNALARRIEADASAVAKYRAGKRSVPDHVIEKIAEIAGMNAADVWLLAQEARNPFRGGTVRTGGQRAGGACGLNLWFLALKLRGRIVEVLHIHDSPRARRTSFPA